MLIQIIRTWWKWRKNWDDICHQCGKCCCNRQVQSDGAVIVNLSDHCRYLDPKTRQCTVYKDRFKKCENCRKVNLWRALFNPTLPEDCGYVQTFRLWKKNGRY